MNEITEKEMLAVSSFMNSLNLHECAMRYALLNKNADAMKKAYKDMQEDLDNVRFSLHGGQCANATGNDNAPAITDKLILDACCGGRMMWHDKNDHEILAMDKRDEVVTFTDKGKNRTLYIHPDVQADFRKMPFPDCSFVFVLFDPPHMLHCGEGSWLFKKSGALDRERWCADLKAGFTECMRVLRPGGTMLFKWNTYQVNLAALQQCFPCSPKFVSHQGKTYHFIFIKKGGQGE